MCFLKTKFSVMFIFVFVQMAFTMPMPAQSEDSFCFHAPGVLFESQKLENTTDRKIYIRKLNFPLLVGKSSGLMSYCNSQVFGVGGRFGSAGSTQDKRNYKYCWSDTFCEEGHKGGPMKFCARSVSHQGVDCRPSAPNNNKFRAVAFSDGVVRRVTQNTTVIVEANDGTECRYLHLEYSSIKVHRGDRVIGGQTIIGNVSNISGGVSSTSIHLHFDCSQVLDVNGSIDRVMVPIYTSLVVSYADSWGIKLKVTDENLDFDSQYEIAP
jgi:hypothetical protein